MKGFQELKGCIHFHLYHLMNEILIGRSICTADNQFDSIIMGLVGIEIVNHPVKASTGFHPHLLNLVFIWQLGKVVLCLHEFSHNGSSVWLYECRKEGFLIGIVSIECTGCHACKLDNGSERGVSESFF